MGAYQINKCSKILQCVLRIQDTEKTIHTGVLIMELLDTLNQIFCTVFDDEDIKISLQMTANDIDGWDSLSHVNLITAVESHFKIRFTQKELLTLKNVGDLYKTISAKIAG